MRNVILVISLVLSTSCSTGSVGGAAVAGGTGGALLGAGTGAALGAVLEDGLVAESAALGAGIGLAVGSVAAATYRYQQKEGALSERNEEIARNDEILEDLKTQIHTRQNILLDEATAMEIDPDDTGTIFTGPTIATPYR